MHTHQTMGSLTPGDCQLMDSHLSASLDILKNAPGRPSLVEIQMKSLLTVLRAEIRKATGMPTVLQPDFAS
jgi:hypothetical protein